MVTPSAANQLEAFADADTQKDIYSTGGFANYLGKNLIS